MSSCLFVLLAGGAPPETLLRRCAEAGVTPTVVEGTSDVRLPSARDIDGLVVVGGPVDPYDARVVPTSVIAALAARMVAREKPTLGIGGGAHLVALALGAHPSGSTWDGGRVRLRDLLLTPAAHDDLLFRHAPDPASWADCSHLGLTDLPLGAVVLATGPDGTIEAARLGARAWVLQGHPQADRDMIGAIPEGCGVPEEFEAFLAELGPMRDSWRPMLTEFFSEVARHGGSRPPRS